MYNNFEDKVVHWLLLKKSLLKYILILIIFKKLAFFILNTKFVVQYFQNLNVFLELMLSHM